MATIIITDLFNPSATLYDQQLTKRQWNALCSILLLCDDGLLKQLDIEMLCYSN